MKKLSQNLSALLLCSVTTTSSALDLSEAMGLAQQYDTTFQAAYANYLATIEASSQSLSAVLPQIGFNAFIQRGNTDIDRDDGNPSSDFDNNRDGYSLNLDQVIFDKTVFDNLNQGDAIAAKALADVESAKQDKIGRAHV